MLVPDKLFGIIGNPLGHSLSPALHDWAFAATGFPGVYLPWPLTADKLADFFRAVRVLGICGGNITIPHKVASLAHMDKVSARARKCGAINTFYWQEGNLCGENTDIIGFISPLLGKKFDHALILGAGGVARAVIIGLQELGIKRVGITNRSRDRAAALASEFGLELVDWQERMAVQADLLINATSLGMAGMQQSLSPYDAKALQGRQGLAYDIVYNPLETVFLQEARKAGWQTQNGLAMFVEQARAAFTLWTGREMPEKQATRHVLELLRQMENRA